VSPLKGILISARQRVSATAHFGTAARIALLLLFTFAAPAVVAAVQGDARAIRDDDAQRAEKVLSKLRLLHEAASADDAGAYRKLTARFYPDLFIKVAEMRPGDLSTDLSTAVFLAEKLGRTWAAAADTAADCRNERPDIYLPLCLGLRGGTVRQLLLAKSRLHARWAEAVLRNNRGEADAEAAHALAEMDAARANDILIAALVVKELKAIEARLPTTGAARGERFNASAAGSDSSGGEFADSLQVAEALLAWMPRSQPFYHLSGARLAYADGLSWYRKARQSKSLLVSAASGFVPDPLKELRLDAAQVINTAHANWKSAAKHTRLAEQPLPGASR
jgi:hypothetical protein